MNIQKLTLALALLALTPSAALALPMYAQRSGRTCGNCHISPTFQDPDGWDNPDLSRRKCNMSCQGCHTNPLGGGLRNTSGRYYGQSTLSVLPLQERSYSDYDRELVGRDLLNWMRSAWTTPVAGGPNVKKTIPSDYQEALAGVGAGQTGGWSAFGDPLGDVSEYAYWDGRYGDLNADPLLQLGGDMRLAYYSGSGSVFPMQLDLHAAVHPIEHVTAMGTVAARGRTAGINAVIGQDRLPFFPRNAFVMVHELPMMAYAKAGIFMPSFGTYIDDHTSFTREFFEMDVSKSEDTVAGVEVGLAPNYPFAQLSFFRNMTPPEAPEGANPGWGAAANLGWRDLGFSVTGSFMIKRRDLEARGDLEAASLGWGFNPMAYTNAIPLTYMGELAVGNRQRVLTGERTAYWATYHEVWWTIFNGLSFRAKYDAGRRDADLADTLQHRFSGALDISPVPGVTLIAQTRYLLHAQDDGGSGFDVFVHTHLWF